MAKSLEEFRKEFLNGNELIADISQYGDVPAEISDEDVYDYSLLFRNEEVAVNYICSNYNVSREELLSNLHEDDALREEYGKDKYLRSAVFEFSKCINELYDGTYILWKVC